MVDTILVHSMLIMVGKIGTFCLRWEMSWMVTIHGGSLIQVLIPIIVVVAPISIQIVTFVLGIIVLLIELSYYLHSFSFNSVPFETSFMICQFLMWSSSKEIGVSWIQTTFISLNSSLSLFSTTMTKSSSLTRLPTSTNSSTIVLTICINSAYIMLSFMSLVRDFLRLKMRDRDLLAYVICNRSYASLVDSIKVIRGATW